MSLGHVSPVAIGGMIFTLSLILIVSISLFVIALKKYKAKLSSFFIGALTFIIFAMVLEQLLHSAVISVFGLETMTGNIFVYALYGAFAAALFEETGRFLAMKFCMAKTLSKENAFMYGVGHGCIEAVLIVGITYLSNILNSFAINSGLIEIQLGALDESLRQQTISQLSALWTTAPSLFYFAGIERMSAIALQLGMTFVMYQGVKSGKIKNVITAYAIHFIADFITAIVASFLPIFATELVIAVVAVLACIYAYKINKTESIEPCN